ncbi:sulfotransferase [Angustibacter sp. McL0619]|uniref:sulfotransferase n=1 Tax=Angustibacter sp. McL0619 TaxID=3415676 RepID=UPI003CE67E1F
MSGSTPAGAPESPAGTVLFVAGAGRSGSTVLSRTLGLHPDVFAPGELRYVWDQGVLRDRPCGCGTEFSRCDFWQEVGAAAFGGWSKDVASRAVTLRRAVDRVRHVPALVAPRGRFRDHVLEYTELLSRLDAALRTVSGASVIVDTSKEPSTAYLMRHVPGIDLRLLHLVRSSQGVCFSWSRSVQRQDRAGALMARHPVARTAVEWDVYNTMVDGLRRLVRPSMLLRYEDFISRPGEVIAQVLQLSGSSARSLLEPDGRSVDLPLSHSVAGNPMRFRSGPERLQLDERWRTEMPRSAHAAVLAITGPIMVRYGYPLRRGASVATVG